MLARAVRKDMPVFGVCLGSQLIAAAAGAPVFKGDAEEIGWFEINISREGLADPVFGALSPGNSVMPVFQLHGDTFELPAGAVHLASSSLFENQAFRLGSRVYGLQFHVESTEAMISEWVVHRPDRDRIQADTTERVEELNRRSELFFRSFLKNSVKA
jgi:GMP synthase-like glutamine amidotransferase